VPTLAVTGVNYPGSITGAAGGGLNVLLSWISQTGPMIDVTRPTVKKVTASPTSGTVTATSGPVAITLTMNEVVTVTGTGAPALLLNDGGKATYASGSGTSALIFNYQPAAGQNTNALAVVGLEMKSNGSIRDAAGNDALMSGAAATFPLKAGTGVSSTARVTTAASSLVEVFGPASGLTFTLGAGDTLKLDAPKNFKGAVAAFAAGDALDLAGFAYNASGGNATSVKYKQTTAATGASPAVGTLTVETGSQRATIQLLGSYMANTFIAASDGSGGVMISEKASASPVLVASSK
jgi:hypothetical protein